MAGTDRPWLVSLDGEGEIFLTYNDGDTTFRITEDGWQTTWLGPGEHSWFPAVEARGDGLVGVSSPSREGGTWKLRAELWSADGSVLDTTIVDEGPVAAAQQDNPTSIGDFIDTGWLPDDRLLVAYGDTPSRGEPAFEAESRINVARGTVVPGRGWTVSGCQAPASRRRRWRPRSTRSCSSTSQLGCRSIRGPGFPPRSGPPPACASTASGSRPSLARPETHAGGDPLKNRPTSPAPRAARAPAGASSGWRRAPLCRRRGC